MNCGPPVTGLSPDPLHRIVLLSLLPVEDLPVVFFALYFHYYYYFCCSCCFGRCLCICRRPPRTPKDLGLLRNRDRRPARGCEEANTWHVAAPCRCWSRIEARNSPFGARTAEQTSRASAPSRALARLEQPGSCFQLQRGLVERCLRFEPAKIRERRRIWCWAGLGLLAVVVEVLWDVFACCGRVVWDKERALEVGTLLLLVLSFPVRCFQIAPLSATEF